MSKRIILMYISEVSGHHSATIAIEKAVHILDPKAEVLNINGFNYTNPISEKVVNSIYMGVIKKFPKVWDYLYDNPKIARRISNMKERLHKFNAPKIKKLFDEFMPDAVACTQAFPCGMAADFKKHYQSSLPLVAILTDYAPHTYWIYNTVDYYVCPADAVAERLIQKGVAPEKIRVLGIPFSPEFNNPVSKNEIMNRLNINNGCGNILIMGGGQGLGPIESIVRSLEKIKKPINVIIVTGTNKKLYARLERKAKQFKNNILLFSYVSKMNELMSVADIIITKPGGITTSEALSKNLPMIIINPIPGQEASNADFLCQNNAALQVADPKRIYLTVERLLNNPAQLKSVRDAAAQISKPNASMDIARLLLEL